MHIIMGIFALVFLMLVLGFVVEFVAGLFGASESDELEEGSEEFEELN